MGRVEDKLSEEIQRQNQPTFAHVADLLLEDVVAIFIHVGAQEVLESVVDLQPRSHHGDPLPHRVALQPKHKQHRHNSSGLSSHKLQTTQSIHVSPYLGLCLC